jgi:hypothetical protein
MKQWLATILCGFFLASFVLGCGEPKKDPTLKDKDKPKPAEKNE